jgi:hypothetical protein
MSKPIEIITDGQPIVVIDLDSPYSDIPEEKAVAVFIASAMLKAGITQLATGEAAIRDLCGKQIILGTTDDGWPTFQIR